MALAPRLARMTRRTVGYSHWYTASRTVAPSSASMSFSTTSPSQSSEKGAVEWNLANEMLSEITIFSKYARFVPERNRRETWNEIVDRNVQMHVEKYPHMQHDIESAYEFVRTKKVLPSMRSMQFGGQAVNVNNARIYNCSFLPVRDVRSFSEIMFLLLGGTGVGFSVQRHHVAQLPAIVAPRGEARLHMVEDCIEGWADAAHALLASYLPEDGQPKQPVMFDLSLIRPKGAPLVTAGGRAPGPNPLQQALDTIRKQLDDCVASSNRLSPLNVHDIVCSLATAVVAGGIRRSALISLFSSDDEEMINCKSGSWWETSPQRSMANNSAMLSRDGTTHAQFQQLWEMIHASGSGEPGLYFTNDVEWGTNPCCEIALEPYQFCNLTEVNVSDVVNQQDLDQRMKAAAFIGTLQAGYTDFHYLRPEWRRVTEKGALLGVSMTGIASGKVMALDLSRAADVVRQTNQSVAKAIDINPAHRLTCVKPAGTTSLVLGTSSGVHAWHAPYYIRRMRVNKDEPLYGYLVDKHPYLLEDDVYTDNTAVASFPQRAPPGSVFRDEPAMSLLSRVSRLHQQWIKPGHVHGENTNNVSTTVSVKPDEWDQVGEWMWHNRDVYNGLCVLPYDGGTYQQAPFEDIDEETFHNLLARFQQFDLSEIHEKVDLTTFQQNVACHAGNCEVHYLDSHAEHTEHKLAAEDEASNKASAQ